MRIKINLIGLVLLLFCFSNVYGRDLINQKYDKQSLIINNLSIDAYSLYEAYISENENSRRFAEIYVIGVLDATEGRLWCGYEVASPSAINEQVFLGLKDYSEKKPNSRASIAVVSKLVKYLPCEG